MPPKGKLPESVIAGFARWIEEGAVDPREKKTRVTRPENEFNLAERQNWWSLRPVADVAVPEVKNRDWPRGA
jgi:hypothetical protein